jgi:MFS family permease
MFNDIASEMLYPVLPVYLNSIGFSVFFIGLLEGFAEATAGLSKGYFGNLSDTISKRAVFVRAGYFLSAISKPVLGLFPLTGWVFFSRTTDKLGKGLRTSARDAMLSDETTIKDKAKIFGLHNGFDTLGAIFGPVLTLILINIFLFDYKSLFIYAFIPGVFAVILTFFLKDKNNNEKGTVKAKSFFTFLHYWKISGSSYKKLVIGLLLFSLINSSDFFMLLMVKNMGYEDNQVLMLYIFYNIIYSFMSYPAGVFADKIGLKYTFIFGVLLFSVVYGSFAFAGNLLTYFIIYFGYGIFAATTVSIAKAWITNITDKKDLATAIGFYSGFNSIFIMFASFIAGFIWQTFSPKAVFIFSATGAFLTAVYLMINTRYTLHKQHLA